MFKKNYSDFECTERINRFLFELEKQCSELNSEEFEYYYEICGVWWIPWFIEVNKKTLTFTDNDISDTDFKFLVENGKIEIVKVYDKSEMNDEFGRKRYRIMKNQIN